MWEYTRGGSERLQAKHVSKPQIGQIFGTLWVLYRDPYRLAWSQVIIYGRGEILSHDIALFNEKHCGCGFMIPQALLYTVGKKPMFHLHARSPKHKRCLVRSGYFESRAPLKTPIACI